VLVVFYSLLAIVGLASPNVLLNLSVRPTYFSISVIPLLFSQDEVEGLRILPRFFPHAQPLVSPHLAIK
jgi:hypothetical protein